MKRVDKIKLQVITSCVLLCATIFVPALEARRVSMPSTVNFNRGSLSYNGYQQRPQQAVRPIGAWNGGGIQHVARPAMISRPYPVQGVARPSYHFQSAPAGVVRPHPYPVQQHNVYQTHYASPNFYSVKPQHAAPARPVNPIYPMQQYNVHQTHYAPSPAYSVNLQHGAPTRPVKPSNAVILQNGAPARPVKFSNAVNLQSGAPTIPVKPLNAVQQHSVHQSHAVPLPQHSVNSQHGALPPHSVMNNPNVHSPFNQRPPAHSPGNQGFKLGQPVGIVQPVAYGHPGAPGGFGQPAGFDHSHGGHGHQLGFHSGYHHAHLPHGSFQSGGVAPWVNYAPAPSFPIAAIPIGAYEPQSFGIGIDEFAAGVETGLLAGAAGAAIYNALKPEDHVIYLDRPVPVAIAPAPDVPTILNQSNEIPSAVSTNKQYYLPPGQYFPATGQYVPPGEYDPATGVFTPGRYIPDTNIFQQGQYNPLTQIFTPGSYDPATGQFVADPINGPVNLGVDAASEEVFD